MDWTAVSSCSSSNCDGNYNETASCTQTIVNQQMDQNASVLEISTAKHHLQSSEQRSFGTSSEMVFPHNKFPSYENSSLHISASDRENSISFLNKAGMKRPSPDDSFTASAEKRKRLSSSPFFMKEEVSEADFQMRLIKQSMASKKSWVYQQVLEKLGVKPSTESNKKGPRAIAGERQVYDNHMKDLIQYGHGSAVCYKRSSDGTKVHDEEGNCYIDEDDFKCFYRLKGQYNETSTVDTNKDDTSKRNLNFTYHGTNGGVAIDHETFPKLIGIHSVPRKVPNQTQHRSHPKHIEAKLIGSSYRTGSGGRQSPVKEEKWWPPSPESIPDETNAREGEGLLKVMTPDEMKAYGLPKQENQRHTQKEEVVVTQEKRKADNESPRLPKADLHDMPPLQLDADGKPSNYKEILLHYIAQHIKNDPKNPRLDTITKNAVAGKQKTMNMDELCKKLVNIREKLEREQMAWKRKLLYSLEVVLIKKIRKLELETGEKTPEGLNLQGATKNEQSSGSQSDMVSVMEDLTGDVKAPRFKKITSSRQSVAAIRGYESS